MTDIPYRTNASSLSDSELILLDVLFDCYCEFQFLRDSIFKPQWNLSYSHGLTDSQLRQSLIALCQSGILSTRVEDRCELFAMTPAGGEVWSSERCPDWERFCMERYSTTSRNRTMMTVVAVSAAIRDDFLSFWPMFPSRYRTTVVSDFGLVPWKTFGRLHVGVATYNEPHEWTMAEFADYTELVRQHQKVLDANRSWWRFIGELQRFLVQGV